MLLVPCVLHNNARVDQSYTWNMFQLAINTMGSVDIHNNIGVCTHVCIQPVCTSTPKWLNVVGFSCGFMILCPVLYKLLFCAVLNRWPPIDPRTYVHDIYVQ